MHAMAEEHDKAPLSPMVERLMRETGISQTQARDLVIMLGVDWSSLVREARLIRKEPSRPW